jgi:reductive dehalogenase
MVMLSVFLWASVVSLKEGERAGARRLGLLGVLSAVPFFGSAALSGLAGTIASGTVVLLAALAMVALLVPLPGAALPTLGPPLPGVDERDIMFSRATLVPGSERFEEYYRRRPENREPDDAFRREPGLLSPGSAHFHAEGFAAADAAFWTIEMLRPFVEGAAPPPGDSISGAPDPPAVPRLGGEAAPAPRETTIPPTPEAMTVFLKAWTLKMGAHSVGVTELQPYHLYSHVGRGPDYGQEVDLEHTFALALTVEMDKEMVDRAPKAPTVMESALQYLRSGVIAVQLADTIRRLGYRARAHVDGNYRVICPLVAKDAGLGELGRMGLLMTPRLGPRVRIAVVTTDLPLAPDSSVSESSTLDFCLRCRKCAEACPSRAISFDPPEGDEKGVRRWRIDAEACFTLWSRLGTDCARCMAVCPYSHPDNGLHALVRWGIRNNRFFRRAALWMEDWVYGRRPPPKPDLKWMKTEAPG